MKKKDTTTLYYYKNEELEDFINSKHETLLVKAEQIAKEQSSRDHPLVKAKISKPYIADLTVGYQGLIHECKTMNQSEIHSANLESEDQHFLEKKKEIEKELELTNNNLRLKTAELEKTDKSKLKRGVRWKRLRPFNTVIVATDAVLCSSVFEETLQLNYLTALIVGICLGASILICAENFRSIINLGKTKFQKRAIAVLVFVFLYAIFLILGWYRSKGMEESDGIITSPFFFGSLQLFFLSVAVLISYFNKPTPEESKLIDAHKLVEEEVKRIAHEKMTLQNQKEEIVQQEKEKEEARKRIIQYAKDIELKVNSKYQEAYQLYTSTNIFTRSDSKIPEFFNYSPEALTLYYQN